jgi:hypothetical protein
VKRGIEKDDVELAGNAIEQIASNDMRIGEPMPIKIALGVTDGGGRYLDRNYHSRAGQSGKQRNYVAARADFKK